MVAECGDHAWRNWAGRNRVGIASYAARSSLEPRITSLESPRAPTRATGFSRGIGADDRVLDARNSVFRLFFAGQQIGCRDVSALAYDAGKRVEPDAAGDKRADVAALLEELCVFSANSQWTVEQGEKAVIAGNSAVDPELGKEIVGAVVQGAAKAQFARKGSGSTVLGRTSER